MQKTVSAGRSSTLLVRVTQMRWSSCCQTEQMLHSAAKTARLLYTWLLSGATLGQFAHCLPLVLNLTRAHRLGEQYT